MRKYFNWICDIFCICIIQTIVSKCLCLRIYLCQFCMYWPEMCLW